jgi:hypothetical protein
MSVGGGKKTQSLGGASEQRREVMQVRGVQGRSSAKKRRTAHSEHSFLRYANLVEHLEIVRPDTGGAK